MKLPNMRIVRNEAGVEVHRITYYGHNGRKYEKVVPYWKLVTTLEALRKRKAYMITVHY